MPGPTAAGAGIGASRGPKNHFVGILMVAFAAFGGILFGYDTGTISGILAMKDFIGTFGDQDGAISTSRTSLIVSILSAGTFFGSLSGAFAADALGRRLAIIMSAVVFSLGVALQTGAGNLATFVVGRFFAGFGVGLVSMLIPMYQSECAPKWIRGAVVGGYQFAITIGILLANVLNNATMNRPNHSAWQIPISIQFVWAFILFTGMFFLPETPRWLIKRGRIEDAARSLSRLTSLPVDDPELRLEIEDITASLKQEEEMGESSYMDCFKPSHNKIMLRTLTGIFIQAWQQLTGINFIFYYGTTFFQRAGVSDPFLISIATSIVNVFMTIPGMWGTDKFGRRPLLLYGAIVMCICEYLVAIVGVTISIHNKSGQQALIALVCIYIAAFASTWGPIAWVITGEIFPLNVRAKAMSLSVASNWLWNWAISFATPYLVLPGKGNADLEVKVFFIWGTTCLGCIIFTYFCIPETKGLSLEQVDLLYQNSTPLTSVAYRRELIANDTHVAAGSGAPGGVHDVTDEKLDV